MIIASAMALGCLTVVGLIYYYGPSGSYQLRNVLLAPGTTQSLRFSENNKTLVFHQVQFLYRDPDTRAWTRLELSIDDYAKVYALIESDVSISGDGTDYAPLFEQGQAASLILMLRPEQSYRPATAYQPFQEVHFSGDHYRVELRVEGEGRSWAYYKHDDILKEILAALGDGR